MMSIENMSFLLGGLLIAVSILGGGIEIKEIKIPAVNGMSRIFSAFAGLAFIALSVLFKIQDGSLAIIMTGQVPVASAPQTNTTPAVNPQDEAQLTRTPDQAPGASAPQMKTKQVSTAEDATKATKTPDPLLATPVVEKTGTDSVRSWLTLREYQRESDKRGAEGFYPHSIDAKCDKGVARYRTDDWKKYAQGKSYEWRFGDFIQEYERESRGLLSRGYRLEYKSVFTDCFNDQRYQSVWISSN
jgi:hypothetical protein